MNDNYSSVISIIIVYGLFGIDFEVCKLCSTLTTFLVFRTLFDGFLSKSNRIATTVLFLSLIVVGRKPFFVVTLSHTSSASIVEERAFMDEDESTPSGCTVTSNERNGKRHVAS